MTEGVFAGHPTTWREWPRGGTRPVLALHCSLAHAGAWAGLAERIAGFTVTAPDLPGHGNSADWDGTGDYHDLTTRIAIAMAERLGDGAAIDVVGHSFGGTVALRLALERPDLVRSLTLFEPVLFCAARAARAPEFTEYAAGNSDFAELLQRGQRDEAAARFHAVWGNGQPLDNLPDRQRRYIVDRIHLIAAIGAVVGDDAAGMLTPGRLESVPVPVLLAQGDQSPPVVGAILSELQRRLPRTHRIAVPGAGHMAPLTHAATLAPAVQAHLDAAGRHG